MANDELIELLKNLQGAGADGVRVPGLLGQLASVLREANEPGGDKAGGVLQSAAARTAGSGLTLLPVVSGLLKLFGVGGKKEELPALEPFTLPAPIRAEAGLSASGETFLIDRGAGDRIRPLGGAPARERGGVWSGRGRTEAGAPQPAGASITVNVQAMDSQSFLDRREDIARAVREAMLQSHSLNDVVSEL